MLVLALILNNLMWYPGGLVEDTVETNKDWPYVAVACAKKKETKIYEYRKVFVWVNNYTTFIAQRGYEMHPKTLMFFVKHARHCGDPNDK